MWKAKDFSAAFPKELQVFLYRVVKAPFSLRTEICNQMVYTAVLSISVFPLLV